MCLSFLVLVDNTSCLASLDILRPDVRFLPFNAKSQLLVSQINLLARWVIFLVTHLGEVLG